LGAAIAFASDTVLTSTVLLKMVLDALFDLCVPRPAGFTALQVQREGFFFPGRSAAEFRGAVMLLGFPQLIWGRDSFE